MPDSPHPHFDDQLEAYLDGLLSDAERAAFVESLRADPARRLQVDLQARIDGALHRLFHVDAPTHEDVAAALVAALGSAKTGGSAAPVSPAATVFLADTPPIAAAQAPRSAAARAAEPKVAESAGARPGSRLYWLGAGVAAAAAIAWVLASLLGGQPQNNQPRFVARPLAEIYRNAVQTGFEPTYECREADRFAATFAHRQGQPLRLLAMPASMKMLGLAYVGGLSRQTTAMLCKVDAQPVMVFVDRANADQPNAAAVKGGDLQVFRDERDGLVFYEVTPLAQPRVTQLFAPATMSGDPVAAPAEASQTSSEAA